jgi:hypothetical protein
MSTSFTPEKADKRGEELKNSQNTEAKMVSENGEVAGIQQTSEQTIQDYKTVTTPEALAETNKAEILLKDAKTKAAEEKLGVTTTPRASN